MGREDAALRVPESRTAGDNWMDRLFDLVGGFVTSERLLADATSSDERAETHHVIGMPALLRDRGPDAKDAFSKCVALKANTLGSEFARVRLAGLVTGAANVRSPQVADEPARQRIRLTNNRAK